MAIIVKSAAEVAEKWASVTPGRAQYYTSGALAQAGAWEANTIASAANFQAAVTAGNIGKMFSGGVKQVGAAKYTRKVQAVGGTRFSEGIAASKADFQTGVDPFLQVIAGLTLPVRAPRGSEANLARVRAVDVALHNKRLSQRAALG